MTVTRRAFACLALLSPLIPHSVLAHSYVAGAIRIGHPWSRPALLGGTGAGFMTLTNGGAEEDRLLSAATIAARTVELHTHVNDAGVMRMRPVADIPVPAGAEVRLAPGGLHVMLIGLTRAFAAGERVPLTLLFARGGSVEVELAVEGRALAGGGGHAH